MSVPADAQHEAKSSESHETSNNEETSDPFDSLLSLENQYHQEGYDLGVADGSRAGRIEGRLFGLQKGFERFAEMGRLQGRAAVWNARVEAGEGTVRLTRHVERLREVTDEGSFTTENGEEEVDDVAGRLKEANGKAEVLARGFGDDGEGARVVRRAGGASAGGVAGRGTGEMEDFIGIGGSRREAK